MNSLYPPYIRKRSLLCLTILLLAFTGCYADFASTAQQPTTCLEKQLWELYEAVRETPASPPDLLVGPNLLPTLRGNTNFSPSQLSSDQRQWYERMWAAIRSSSPTINYAERASSGNLYDYARDLNSYLTSLLMVLRITGDLHLLDEIDRNMQLMRKQLRTTWIGSHGNSVTPNDGTRDLRRWLYLRSDDSSYGEDTHVMDAVMTHAMVANVAYAYELNRGVRSPGGIDYGERADFWKDYLKNDFEQIWRIRNGNNLPYWSHQVSHSYRSNIRWHYYMGRLFGDSRYSNTAVSLANTALRNERDVNTPLGPARVWSHRLLDKDYGLQPIIYAAYDWMIIAEQALDGFGPYARSDYMRKHATTLAHFVMNNGSDDFSFDVGGMRSRAGIPSRNPWSGSSLAYRRESTSRYLIYPFAHLAAYDESHNVRTISEQVYLESEMDEAKPEGPLVPAGMVVAFAINNCGAEAE